MAPEDHAGVEIEISNADTVMVFFIKVSFCLSVVLYIFIVVRVAPELEMPKRRLVLHLMVPNI